MAYERDKDLPLIGAEILSELGEVRADVKEMRGDINRLTGALNEHTAGIRTLAASILERVQTNHRLLDHRIDHHEARIGRLESEESNS